jgi:hypothetical protein
VRRNARIGRGCAWTLGGLAALIALVPWQGYIWDGGFPNVECRLKFVDANNKPVPGVTLTVFTEGGGVCHFYPVDEFVPDRPVISDAEGRMVFRHTGGGLEFAGHEYYNLFGMRIGETSAPRYRCMFSLDGREVFSTPFNFHHPEWNQFRQPAVKRIWQPPWDLAKHGLQSGDDLGQWQAWKMRLFDCNHDGKLDREEATAANYFERQQCFVAEAAEKPTERGYEVVERTIVIPNP